MRISSDFEPGHDVVGSSETGSGKTAAFTLPILQVRTFMTAVSKITFFVAEARRRPMFYLRISINADKVRYFRFSICQNLTGSRELAIQIAEQMSAFGAPIPLKLCLIVGGRGAYIHIYGCSNEIRNYLLRYRQSVLPPYFLSLRFTRHGSFPSWLTML